MDSTGFKGLTIGHLMYTKDLYQLDLKRKVLIVLLSMLLSIAKKEVRIQFLSSFFQPFSQKLSKSADYVPGMMEK